MHTLNAIIATFSESEIREFELFLGNKNRRGDVKNIRLLRSISQKEPADIARRLYKTVSKNAYHALCKRVQDAAIDFVATKSFASEASEEMDILKLLLASRVFFEYKAYKIGFKVLAKAETKALKLDIYAILNEIYYTKIQYAHHHKKLVLSDLISEAQTNQKLFRQEQELNMAYATIKAALRQKEHKDINSIITTAFSRFNIEIHDTLTYKSLYKLMHITAEQARLQGNYYTISSYMMEIYGRIKAKKNEIPKHRFYHIEILYLMAFTSFRNKAFEMSMDFVEQMEFEMYQDKRRFYKRFLEKLVIIKSLNLNYTGDYKQAIKLLQVLEEDSLEAQLSLVMCHFQQENYSEAYKKQDGYGR